MNIVSYRKGGKEKKVVVYNSDDEDVYKGEKQPNPNDDDYYMDDIDDFHAKKDKVCIHVPV